MDTVSYQEMDACISQCSDLDEVRIFNGIDEILNYSYTI